LKGRSNRTTGNRLRLLSSDKDLFPVLFDLINQAKHFIHIQVYILADDTTGKTLIERLKAAVGRGVKVYLMIDNYGSSALSSTLRRELTSSGIVLKRFSKSLSLKNFRLGRRLHSKIVVIDNRFALVGGMNFADRYSGMDGKVPWLDFAILCEGPAAYRINSVAAAYWRMQIRRQLKRFKGIGSFPHGSNLKWTFNDWLRNRFQVSQSYRLHIMGARKEIWLVASYFIPARRILRLLKMRREAGVAVNIVLSKESDVLFIKDAMEYLYRFLLRKGITIYEWSDSVLHAKLAVVDNSWVTIGSYNLNQLSDWGSLEANAETTDPDFVKVVMDKIHGQILPGCKKIEAAAYLKKTGSLVMFKQAFSFFLVRIALKLLFLLSTKRP
jgi:cardiolipin synthase